MSVTQKRDFNESPIQKELDAIASTIDFGKLPRRKPLYIDKKGVVNIDLSNPNYQYWLGEDE